MNRKTRFIILVSLSMVYFNCVNIFATEKVSDSELEKVISEQNEEIDELNERIKILEDSQISKDEIYDNFMEVEGSLKDSYSIYLTMISGIIGLIMLFNFFNNKFDKDKIKDELRKENNKILEEVKAESNKILENTKKEFETLNENERARQRKLNTVLVLVREKNYNKLIERIETFMKDETLVKYDEEKLELLSLKAQSFGQLYEHTREIQEYTEIIDFLRVSNIEDKSYHIANAYFKRGVAKRYNESNHNQYVLLKGAIDDIEKAANTSTLLEVDSYKTLQNIYWNICNDKCNGYKNINFEKFISYYEKYRRAINYNNIVVESEYQAKYLIILGVLGKSNFQLELNSYNVNSGAGINIHEEISKLKMEMKLK